MKNLIISILLLFSTFVYSQKNSIESLQEKISQYNKADQYDLSVKLLTDFINNKETSANDKYAAYLIKSDIYKNLFKYQHALKYLDLALQEGKKGSDFLTAVQEIKAEKAFIYFEMQDFDKAKLLMNELEQTAYKNLNNKYLLFIYTQEGYFLLKNKNYAAAEMKLNDAVKIAETHYPQELPIVYGKQIELYNITNEFKKRDNAYQLGIGIAQKYKNLKYEFYLNEVYKNVFSNNNDTAKAFIYQKKCDSLFALYNSNDKSSKVEILEQEIKNENFDNQLKKKQKIQIGLMLLSILLIIAVVFLIKLFNKNKQNKILIERENKRIQEEIKHLKSLANENVNTFKELSSFNLTERQLEIIKLVQNGKNNKEIAADLFISENTVKYHLKTIYTILEIKHRNELSNFK
ncbi:regulatory protein, luxR family [Paenimyroides ummariense]|uniref:Regulatory protein, luxR family n=1 Tax=Paenimyroides ummariense TaxID=913024 RepID=A0A1I4X2N4_9FLAO|nr:helix-turn-helix transcriptional regulator [Paenimyroides ummariense]SFN20261.1 regulatory protein, luxR family [Paenimyroides ummariense]